MRRVCGDINTREDGVIVTTLYLGSVERISKSTTNTVTWKRYLGAFAFYSIDVDNSGTPVSIERAYLYKDYQGSTDVITDAAGSVITTMSFDVWGKRRNAQNGRGFQDVQLYKLVNEITNNKRLKICQCKYLNNVIEQDHRRIRHITRLMLGFKNFHCAQKNIGGNGSCGIDQKRTNKENYF